MGTMSVFECKKYDGKSKENVKVGSITIDSTEERAKLYFYGDIVSSSWESFYFEEDKCPQDIADFLSELDNYQSIDVYFNSGGGSVDAGMAIYNILKRHPGEKVAHVDGLAASIASVIMFACDKVIVPENAQIMIHKPWCEAYGNADRLRKRADELDMCQNAITSVYMNNVKENITEETITKMINAETWLTGKEASEYFNIETEEGLKAVAMCKSEYFDKYKNAPKDLTKNEDEGIELMKLQMALYSV